MIPKEVWQKVLKVGYRTVTECVTPDIGGADVTVFDVWETGTAFTIDRGEKQYLVSANHVFKKGVPYCVAKIHPNNHTEIWEELDTEPPLRNEHDDVDVIVLPLTKRITPPYGWTPESKTSLQGQDVYFLGFLGGVSVSERDISEINNGFQRPFVRRGIIAGHRIPYLGLEEELYHDIYIDGHGDEGFSGGPVISINKGTVQVIGVITGRLTEHYVCKESPQGKCGEKNPKETTLKLDTGIAHASYIEHALSLIEEYENSN